MKTRLSEAGVHLFDRVSGLNVLLDEVKVPVERFSPAPRFMSVALTNACDLRCSYCYAPKFAATLDPDRVATWATELDGGGCLGIGFGGGEPTIHPHFVDLCSRISSSTSMAVTFTTHGHRLTTKLADRLRGSIHFARISVDGVSQTYERLRGRPFESVQYAATLLRSMAPLGVNTVVNADTVTELDAIVEFAVDVGASELLLLPEQPTATSNGMSDADAQRLVRWVQSSLPPMRLTIARSGLESRLPTAEPIPNERPLDSHLHIDATGTLRPSAYSSVGLPIEGSILDAVLALREAV